MKKHALLSLVALGCSPGSAQEPLAPPTQEIIQGFGHEIDLACELHRALTADSPGGNAFFSPASISSALAMVAEGARGETAAELARVLQGSEELDLRSLHALHSDLTRRLEAASSDVEWNEANGIWAADTTPLIEATQDALREHYGASIEAADFQGQAAAVRQEINRWVEAQTKNRIKDLMPEDSIDSLTQLVLVNAVHFLGKWEEEFEKEITSDLPFTLADGGEVTASFIQDKRDMRVGFFSAADERIHSAEEAALTVFELPYRGGQLSFVGLIPSSPQGLAELETRMDAPLLQAWLKGLAEQKVQFAMPKLDLEPSYNLIPVLQGLGLTHMLDANTADLTGFFGQSDDRLSVTSAVHKAFLKVDEAGTEAAAATGVAVGRASSPMAPPTVRADRPFIFLIRERSTGAILFMGRIVNPIA